MFQVIKSKFQSNVTQALLVFAFSLIVISLQVLLQEKEIPYADNISYMAVALPLHETGVYGDGNFKGTVLEPGPNGEGMFFAPLYPAFLSAIMFFSDGFKEASRCSIELIKPPLIEKQCELDFTFFYGVQVVLSVVSALFIWLSSLALFQRRSLAWVATGLVLTVGTLAQYAGSIMAEALIMPLFYMSCFGLIKCYQTSKWQWALMIGIACGALILTKPSFLYMIYVFVPVFTVLGVILLLKSRNSIVLRNTLITAISVAVVVTPWIYRNQTVLGHAAVTFGYGPFTLSQRVAYNDMSKAEWFVSWVYGIPGEGDSIAEKLFPKETYERWSWSDPKGFYRQGNDVLRAQTLEEAGSHDAHLSHLIEHYIVIDLPPHIATTFPLVYRGMWVFGFWIFFPYIAFICLCVHCIRKNKYDYLLFSLPAWFMLGLHGFVTVNIARYNIIMQGCLGMALAWSILTLWNRRQHRQNKER